MTLIWQEEPRSTAEDQRLCYDYTLVRNDARADGSEMNVFRITLTRPDNGRPAAGQSVKFSTSAPMILSETHMLTDASGSATVSMTRTVPSGSEGYALFVDAVACCTVNYGQIRFW